MTMMKEANQPRQDDVWHRGLVLMSELDLEIQEVPSGT